MADDPIQPRSKHGPLSADKFENEVEFRDSDSSYSPEFLQREREKTAKLKAMLEQTPPQQ